MGMQRMAGRQTFQSVQQFGPRDDRNADHRRLDRLHVFQKKSTRGTATPKTDIDLIRERLKIAEQFAEELLP